MKYMFSNNYNIHKYISDISRNKIVITKRKLSIYRKRPNYI